MHIEISHTEYDDGKVAQNTAGISSEAFDIGYGASHVEMINKNKSDKMFEKIFGK
jgi:hypothetical protein